ncbi:MAG: hypothetical protein IPM71_02200 [Bacteroidota bacterium]|nr:MAG: hypothetical protein IPM71_02200 [Bacteroidota bacterium]
MTHISTLHYSVHNLASIADYKFNPINSSAEEHHFDQKVMNWLDQTELVDVRQEVVERILKIASSI